MNTEKHCSAADTSAAVDDFLAALAHPQLPLIHALREVISGIDSRVQEGIKWKSPSWRLNEYFATTHLRSKIGVGVILHLGAKARALPAGGLQIADPTRLLTWLAADRALVEFRDLTDLTSKQAEFQTLLRQWLQHLSQPD